MPPTYARPCDPGVTACAKALTADAPAIQVSDHSVETGTSIIVGPAPGALGLLTEALETHCRRAREDEGGPGSANAKPAWEAGFDFRSGGRI